jgi:hypothetical protein
MFHQLFKTKLGLPLVSGLREECRGGAAKRCRGAAVEGFPKRTSGQETFREDEWTRGHWAGVAAREQQRPDIGRPGVSISDLQIKGGHFQLSTTFVNGLSSISIK